MSYPRVIESSATAPWQPEFSHWRLLLSLGGLRTRNGHYLGLVSFRPRFESDLIRRLLVALSFLAPRVDRLLRHCWLPLLWDNSVVGKVYWQCKAEEQIIRLSLRVQNTEHNPTYFEIAGMGHSLVLSESVNRTVDHQSQIFWGSTIWKYLRLAICCCIYLPKITFAVH